MTEYIINDHGNIVVKPEKSEQEKYNEFLMLPETAKIKRAFEAGFEAGKRSSRMIGCLGERVGVL